MLNSLENLQLITLPGPLSGEAQAVCALQRSGAGIVHLRKPGFSAAALEALLNEWREAGVAMERVTLHGSRELALRFGCGGVHLPAAELPAASGDRLRRSASAHSWEEAEPLASVADYVWLSPLFDSISKPGYRSGIDLRETPARFAALEPVLRERIVALGGISAGNIVSVRRAGFRGAALLGAVWSETDGVVGRYQLIRRRWLAAGSRLQLISDGNLSLLEHFLRGGGRWVQLRMKGASSEEIVARGREFSTLCRRYGALMLLNDTPELVAEAGADGVHLGKTDMAPAQARTLLGSGAIIGATANTLDDILALDPEAVDYIGLGPYRYTTTKKNLAPVLGLDGYREILSALRERGIELPVTAIGGLLPADVPGLLAAGVDAVAVSGGISTADDPERVTTEFLKSWTF